MGVTVGFSAGVVTPLGSMGATVGIFAGAGTTLDSIRDNNQLG